MSETDLLISRIGHLGSIRLNRPKALNSLTLGMVRGFARALDEFGLDADIHAVLVTGEGERGLCAGGDIRALYDLPAAERDSFKAFWREEYELNARIASFPKPYVAVMDGVVMGGGVGVSAHGNRRVATERTRLAMPETGIGFIPDVGGSWLLTRDGGAGVYMALSGASVTAADAIHVGLADLVINSGDIARLLQESGGIGGVESVEVVPTWSCPTWRARQTKACWRDISRCSTPRWRMIVSRTSSPRLTVATVSSRGGPPGNSSKNRRPACGSRMSC